LLIVTLVCGPGISAPAHGAEDGLPLGEIIFKPGVRVEAVYDSNVRRAQLAPEADFGLQVRPSISFVYPGDNFRWVLDAYYRFFTYFNASDDPTINHTDLRVFTEFGLGTRIDVNRQGKVGLDFAPSLHNRPASSGVSDNDSETAGRAAGDSGDQELGVSVPVKVLFRPTKAFQVHVQAGWDWARPYFPQKAFDPDPIILGNRHELGGGGGVDWRFFPRSHVLFNGEVSRIIWGEFDSDTVNHTAQLPSTQWKLWLGLQGDITRKLSFMGLVGYGNVDFGEEGEEGSEFDVTGVSGLLGQVEFSIKPALTQRLGVGFRRDFRFRYFTNRIIETQAYFKYRGLFFERLQVAADFSYTYRDLAGWVTRTEHQWGAGVNVDVLLARWFHVLAGYRFSAVDPSSTNEGEFIDNRITLGVSVGY